MEAAPKRHPALPLGIAAGWVTFVWSWIRVAQGTPLTTMAWGIMVLVAMTVIVVAITAWWISHNLSIYRRKGPRRSVPLAMPEYRADFVGRALHGDWMMLRRSSVVVIDVDGEGKQFLPGIESAEWGLRG